VCFLFFSFLFFLCAFPVAAAGNPFFVGGRVLSCLFFGRRVLRETGGKGRKEKLRNERGKRTAVSVSSFLNFKAVGVGITAEFRRDSGVSFAALT